MYKLCQTEQSAARQRQLEQGLLAAISVRRYEDLSVSDLCAQLGIPRKAFYRYFSSKDGALHALLDHTLMSFEFFATPSAHRRSLEGDITQFFEFWLEQRPLLDALERNGLSGLLIERSLLYAVSGTAMPRRFLPNDAPSVQEQVVTFAVCGLMSMVLRWHHTGFRTPVAQMAETAVRLLSQPLFPNAAALL